MPSTSFRLDSELKRAAKESDHSVSTLARSGLERAVIDDYVSVCWLCGVAIYEEASLWLDRARFREFVAEEDIDIEWPYQDEPQTNPHPRYENKERWEEDPVTRHDDEYYTKLGEWLALPRTPVEFCKACSDQVRKMKSREIDIDDIPVPFIHSAPNEQGAKSSVEPVPRELRPSPQVSYGAQTAAVNAATYLDFHQRNDPKGSFWWLARERSQRLFRGGIPVWPEAAVRSHAYHLAWGDPLVPIFEESLSQAVKCGDNWYQIQEGSPPLFDREPLSTEPYGVTKETAERELEQTDRCPACGTRGQERQQCCSVCFYPTQPCPDCGDNALSIRFDGINVKQRAQLRELTPRLRCETCTSEDYLRDEERFLETYRPIFQEQEPMIPIVVSEI
jgi:hypothetical protein